MSSSIGNNVKCSVFGESHGAAIGCVIDGLPAGESIDMDEVLMHMARRAPGRDKTATPRRESDTPVILSGVLNGITTGAPLAVTIENRDTRSGDYTRIPRPGHADYTGFVRYGGYNDIRGGGHFSGRLTAPLVFAGSVCRQILRRRGVAVGGHILCAGGAYDSAFDEIPEAALLDRLSRQHFPLIDPAAGQLIRGAIEQARMDGDSVGGIIEAAAAGLPSGLGSPMFGGMENLLSAALFGIPAVKGVEFGDGFAFAGQRGSTSNDAFTCGNTACGSMVRTVTNHCGGILGGITTGMPLTLRAVIKPTPSISKPQRSVNLDTGLETELVISGRHDPCIVPRAVPVVESVMALVLLDIMESGNVS